MYSQVLKEAFPKHITFSIIGLCGASAKTSLGKLRQNCRQRRGVGGGFVVSAFTPVTKATIR